MKSNIYRELLAQGWYIFLQASPADIVLSNCHCQESYNMCSSVLRSWKHGEESEWRNSLYVPKLVVLLREGIPGSWRNMLMLVSWSVNLESRNLVGSWQSIQWQGSLLGTLNWSVLYATDWHVTAGLCLIVPVQQTKQCAEVSVRGKVMKCQKCLIENHCDASSGEYPKHISEQSGQ